MTSSWVHVTVTAASLLLGGPAAIAQDADIAHAFAAATPESRIVIDHAEWAALLGRYLHADPGGINRFAYGAVTPADHARLKTYIARLQTISPRALNAHEQHAFWINLYNALTIEVVLDHYPVKSIRDISSGWFTFGPWDLPLATVAGRSLTLNNIEHDILRKNWRDPRVHYALNCASLGCPNLAPLPYSGGSLDRELDTAAHAFVNHPRAVWLRNGRLVLSNIYNWYAKDFGDGSYAAVIAHIRHYADATLAAQLTRQATMSAYQYDWQLNAPGTQFEALQ